MSMRRQLPQFIVVSLLCPWIASYAQSTVATTRRQAIEGTLSEIQAECSRAADGNWDRWYEALAPFRAEMRAKAVVNLLQTNTNPPLLDDPRELDYLFQEDGDLQTWTNRRISIQSITQVSAWLRKKNIDLIFVPVPKMTEVYASKLASSVPADGFIAPQVRKAVADLLRADVEVVDLLPQFLKAAAENPEPLYLSDDSHWSPRGQAVASLVIADGLRRYAFVAAAKAKPAIFNAEAVTPLYPGGCWANSNGVTDELSAIFRAYHWAGSQISTQKHQYFISSQELQSPVALIGDSYSTFSIGPGMAIDALISKAVNFQVGNLAVNGVGLNPIKDLVREPELLASRKVIVWITLSSNVYRDQDRWKLPELR